MCQCQSLIADAELSTEKVPLKGSMSASLRSLDTSHLRHDDLRQNLLSPHHLLSRGKYPIVSLLLPCCHKQALGDRFFQLYLVRPPQTKLQ